MLAKTSIAILTAASALAGSLPAQAGPATDRMTGCLVRNTTAQDRIDLGRWMVLSFSKHPEVSGLITADDSSEEGIQRTVAALFQRLLMKDCLEDSRTAIEEDGNLALQTAFKALGQVAAAELLKNREVQGEVQRFVQYLDTKALERALR